MTEDRTSTRPADAPAAVLPLSQDPELIADFVVESHEHLHAIEAGMLALERDARDREAIHGVFRAFHTMKGLAGFLEMESVRSVAHEVETVLDLARNRRLEITTTLIDVVPESTD